MELLLYIAIIVIASLVVWRGSDWLEWSSYVLADHYNLPPVVRGSIITAVGSSFPELSTAIISTLLHGEFDLGVSVIVGSAIFNILVIPGLSVIMASDLESDRILVYKDAQFYLTSIAVLALVFALAVIYFPVDDVALKGSVTREIAVVPLLLYLLYLFLQRQETKDFKKLATEAQKTKGKSVGKAWLYLTGSLALIVVSVEGLVRGAIFLGDYFNTPNFVWGVTVVAAATSVPDSIVSIKVAMRKNGLVSLANVLGSNIFDLLVAVPAGVLIAGTSIVDFHIAAPMMMALTIATVVLYTFMRTDLSLSNWEGWVLIGLYAAFIVWMLLESIGVMSIVVR